MSANINDQTVPQFSIKRTMSQIQQSFVQSSRESQYEGGLTGHANYNREEDDFGMESDSYDLQRQKLKKIHGLVPNTNSMISSNFQQSSNGQQNRQESSLVPSSNISKQIQNKLTKKKMIPRNPEDLDNVEENILYDQSQNSTFDSKYFIFDHDESQQDDDQGEDMQNMMAPLQNQFTPLSNISKKHLSENYMSSNDFEEDKSPIIITNSKVSSSIPSKISKNQSSKLSSNQMSSQLISQVTGESKQSAKQQPYQSMVSGPGTKNRRDSFSMRGGKTLQNSIPLEEQQRALYSNAGSHEVTRRPQDLSSQSLIQRQNSSQNEQQQSDHSAHPYVDDFQFKSDITDDEEDRPPPQNMYIHDVKSPLNLDQHVRSANTPIVPYDLEYFDHPSLQQQHKPNLSQQAMQVNFNSIQKSSEPDIDEEPVDGIGPFGMEAANLGRISEISEDHENSIKKVARFQSPTTNVSRAASRSSFAAQSINWKPVDKPQKSNKTRSQVRQSMHNKIKDKKGFENLKKILSIDNQSQHQKSKSTVNKLTDESFLKILDKSPMLTPAELQNKSASFAYRNKKKQYVRQKLMQTLQMAKKTPNRHEFLRNFFIENEIPCKKYHYTVDKDTPSIFDHFDAVLKLSSDGKSIVLHNFKPFTRENPDDFADKHDCSQHQHLELQPEAQEILKGKEENEEQSSEEEHSSRDSEDVKNADGSKKKRKKKQKDDYIEYKRMKSKASCKLKEITSFLYGGFSSRFWMLRKHVNSMSDTSKLPFYSWECITLQLKLRDIDIVIENSTHLVLFLEFLMFELQTADGLRNSAKPFIDNILIEQTNRSENNKQLILKSSDEDIEKLKSYNKQMYIQNLLKKYKLMKIRMKISYLAFQNTMTIQELWLSTILKTYKLRKKQGLVRNPYPNPKDNKVIMSILAGKSSIRELVKEERIENMKKDNESAMDFSQTHKTEGIKTENTASLQKKPENEKNLPRVLDSHIERALDRNNAEDIFLHIMRKTDQQMTTDEIADSFVHYKFRKIMIKQELNRIRMLIKLNMTEGPIFILCLLKVIQYTKDLFILELEKGIEVKIPNHLCQSSLPLSFRYYDSLIQIVKNNFSNQKKDFSKLKKSISYAFDQKFAQPLFGKTEEQEDDSKRKQKFQYQMRKQQFEQSALNFRESPHIDQVQYSKFIKIDDDFINQADRVKEEIKSQGGTMNKFQREQRLFDELGEIHVKYCQAKQLAQQRKEFLKYKFQFSNQLNHLKHKGKKLQALQMLHENVIEKLRDRIFCIGEQHDHSHKEDSFQLEAIDEENSIVVGDREQKVHARRKCNQKTPGQNNVNQDKLDDLALRLKSASKPNSRLNTEQMQSNQSPMETKQSLWYSTNSQRYSIAGNIKTQEDLRLKKLIISLHEEFENNYLEEYNGNDLLAYKKFANTIGIEGNDAADILFHKRRVNNLKEIKDLVKSSNQNFEKKTEYVDMKIENDIQYFSKDYSQRQKQMLIIRKQLIKNQKKLLLRKIKSKLGQMMFGNERSKSMAGGLINLKMIQNKGEDPSNFNNTNGGEIQQTRMISPKTINSRTQYNSMSPDFVSQGKTPHFTTNASPDKTPHLIHHKSIAENTRSPQRQIKFFRGQNEKMKTSGASPIHLRKKPE